MKMKAIATLAIILMTAAAANAQIHQTQEELDLIAAQESNLEDQDANYNLAKYYYDQAVTLTQDVAAGALPGVEGVEAEIDRWYMMALVPAQKAYDLNPKSIKSVELLSGIYLGMNNVTQHKEMEKELKKLKK